MSDLPRPDQRVATALEYAGLRATQVCVVADATDEEILAHCNSTNPQGVSGGWHSVVRTIEDCDRLGVDHVAVPGDCEDCPGRKHMIAVCM